MLLTRGRRSKVAEGRTQHGVGVGRHISSSFQPVYPPNCHLPATHSRRAARIDAVAATWVPAATMQDPNEDTEWNDALRRHGILPPKPKELEVTEEQIASLVDQAIQERLEGKKPEDRTLDELEELEDELDDRVFEEFR